MRGAVRAGKGFTLFNLNVDMNDIIKIIKSLEDSGVLINGVTEKVNMKLKKRRISLVFVSIFSCFNSETSDFFSSKRYKWKRS